MTPRHMKAFWITMLLVAGTATISLAQVTLIVQEKVSVSRVLAGHVDIGIAKVPAEGISVEARRSDGTVVGFTKTDASGFFRVDSPKVSGLIHVLLSAPGVNPYELRVKITRRGPTELRIHMSNAT